MKKNAYFNAGTTFPIRKALFKNLLFVVFNPKI